MTACQSELLQLKNLGVASVNILRAVGVNTHADLQRLGAVETYRRIRARNIHVSKVMLYALEGALMDIHWNDIPPDLKARLVQAAECSAELTQATA
uniref:TfoX/Sxy family protein n=1 Tax=Cellvibrio fontiphilus TaxID=1815559 RepID=UPI002B4BCD01|nr:TfoX/Sxy family protein [Cellvibrio fontiphilus]